MPNIAYPGGDIKCIQEKSFSECEQLCKLSKKCAKFTYVTNNYIGTSKFILNNFGKRRRRECCLKTDEEVIQSFMQPKKLMGVISGPRECGKLLFIDYWHIILYSFKAKYLIGIF